MGRQSGGWRQPASVSLTGGALRSQGQARTPTGAKGVLPGPVFGGVGSLPEDSLAQEQGGKPPVSGQLDWAVTEIRKGELEVREESDLGAAVALKRIFDSAGLAPGLKAAESGTRQAVSGKTQEAAEKITRTVEIADSASGHDAPGLYSSALRIAKEAVASGLGSGVARQVARTVMDYAFRKAERALPELANQAYEAAAQGDFGRKQVERIIGSPEARTSGSLDKWELLLGSPGEPLVYNMSRLKRDVRRVQDEARQAQSKRISVPKIWFERRGRSFKAVLPASSVALLPKSLELAFALKDSPAAVSWRTALEAFRLSPTPANVYRALRQAGLSRTRSLLAAAKYWVRVFLAGLRDRVAAALRRIAGKGLTEPEKAALIQEINRGYEAALGLLARTARSMSMSEVRALISHAMAMARGYERLSGSSAGVAAVETVSRRIREESERRGLKDDESSPALLALARGDLDSLSTWVRRIHEAALEKEGAGEEQALDLSGARESLEALLAEVRERPASARELAAEIQSLDSEALGLVTIGRAWIGGRELLALRALKSGKAGRLEVSVLRDESGRPAFGRAELLRAGGPQVLSARSLSSLLGR